MSNQPHRLHEQPQHPAPGLCPEQWYHQQGQRHMHSHPFSPPGTSWQQSKQQAQSGALHRWPEQTFPPNLTRGSVSGRIIKTPPSSAGITNQNIRPVDVRRGPHGKPCSVQRYATTDTSSSRGVQPRSPKILRPFPVQAKKSEPGEKDHLTDVKESAPILKYSVPDMKNSMSNVKGSVPYVKTSVPYCQDCAPNVKDSVCNTEDRASDVKDSEPYAKESAPNIKTNMPNVKVSASDIKDSILNVKDSAPSVKCSEPGINDSEICKPSALDRGFTCHQTTIGSANHAQSSNIPVFVKTENPRNIPTIERIFISPLCGIGSPNTLTETKLCAEAVQISNTNIGATSSADSSADSFSLKDKSQRTESNLKHATHSFSLGEQLKLLRDSVGIDPQTFIASTSNKPVTLVTQAKEPGIDNKDQASDRKDQASHGTPSVPKKVPKKKKVPTATLR